MLPAIQASREASRRTGCQNNLKQIGLAIAGFQLAKTTYPASNTDVLNNWDVEGRVANHSWGSVILPYVEMRALEATIDYSLSAMNAKNRPAAGTVVTIYRCPSYTGLEFTDDTHYPAGKYAIGNYVSIGASDVDHIWDTGNEPEGVIFPQSAIRPAEITDGLTNTMFIAESREERMRVWIDGRTAANTALRYDSRGEGVDRTSLNFTPYYDDSEFVCAWGPSSMHPGGAHHLLGDGSVHFFVDQIEPKIYVALCTCAGDEVAKAGE